MSSCLTSHSRWSFYLAAVLMLALWAQPVQAFDCTDGSAVNCSGTLIINAPVPLMLDGRLSDAQALPPPVSSPVLDASLEQLRQDQTAIELRMRLLEQQGPALARPRASPQIAGAEQGHSRGGWWSGLQDAGAVQQFLEHDADGLIAALLALLAVCVPLLLMRRSQRHKAQRELQVRQALQTPGAIEPEWSGDVDFDLKPFIFDDRR